MALLSLFWKDVNGGSSSEEVSVGSSFAVVSIGSSASIWVSTTVSGVGAMVVGLVASPSSQFSQVQRQDPSIQSAVH